MYNLLLIASQALSFPQQNDIYLEVVDAHIDSMQVENEVSHQWVFFAPHENEFVANQYVAKLVQKKGGKFVVLRQRGSRYIALVFANKTLYIDPNRMFTEAGVRASLTKLNPKTVVDSELFIQAVARATLLGKFVVKQLGGVHLNTKANINKTWVAIHNNTNGYEGDGKSGVGDVSIIRYQSKLDGGALYLIDTANYAVVNHATHNKVNTKFCDEDDLFFVTDRQDFKQMQKHHWNAVLQNPIVVIDPEEDDGSLSVYAQMHGVRYINVEAERELTLPTGKIFGENHLLIQQKMIDFTFELLNK